MRYALIALLLTAAATIRLQSQPVSLRSPDGRLTLQFQTLTTNKTPVASGALAYDLAFQNHPLLEPSAMSLELEGQPPLGANVRIARSTPSQTDETYRLVGGKANPVRNHFNALRIELEETAAPNRKLVVEARAYNDAVAFRYVVPEQPGLSGFRLAKETTEFRVTRDATAYAMPLPNFQSQYEGEYVKLPVSAFSYQGGVLHPPLVGLPVLLEFPGTAWLAITEADLRDYAAMYLLNPATEWPERWFESRLAPHTNNPNLCVTGTLPHHSAWRVLMVGSEPGRLIESTVLTSLNPPSAIADTSWIQPGKCAWDWWGGSVGPDGVTAFTNATMRHYVDFAADSGLEYMLVDAGWSPRDDITQMNGSVDIPALVQYAAAKGVKIWIWAHWTAVASQMDEAFPLYQKWGVAGVKTDFMSRDDQDMIAFYYRVAEKAAQHRLMIDFHGATKPWGMERTWPNVLGYEGVLGMEWSKATARDNPDHHLMLPFTRMLAGTMDYTPGGFNNVTREEFRPSMDKPMVMGTRAHQLAMYVVYECPFQMVSDYPAAYGFGVPASADARREAAAFQFIKDVPATWDETRVLHGIPGEYITIARRNGDEWFLGSMTSWTPRSIELPLDFLGAGRYTAEIYADAPDAAQSPKNVTIRTQSVRRTGTLKVQLAPGGGCAVRFVPRQ